MIRDIDRYEEMMEQFKLWRDLSISSAASVGEIVMVALTAGACLGLATLVVTAFAWGRVEWLLGMLMAALPVAIVGVGGLLLTTRLVVWKIRWWTEWLEDQHTEDEERKSNIRLVPVKDGLTIEGVYVEDLKYFLRACYNTHDWTQRRWRGAALPSGRPCTEKYHRDMIEILEKAGILCDYGPRQKGYLRGTLEQALLRLGIEDDINCRA
jgi:hypothetical protein